MRVQQRMCVCGVTQFDRIRNERIMVTANRQGKEVEVMRHVI